MNWGLFLALASFLVPLSFAIRLVANAAYWRGRAFGVVLAICLALAWAAAR